MIAIKLIQDIHLQILVDDPIRKSIDLLSGATSHWVTPINVFQMVIVASFIVTDPNKVIAADYDQIIICLDKQKKDREQNNSIKIIA